MKNQLSKKQRIQIDKLCQAGKVSDARMKLVEICQQSPQNLDAWLLQGELSIKANDIYSAITCFKTILQVDPKNKAAIKHLANCYLSVAQSCQKSGDLVKALEVFNVILELDKENIQALSSSGHIYYETRQYNQAAKKFKALVSLLPDEAEPNNNLGAALNKLGLVEEAYKYFSRAYELNPHNPSYQLNFVSMLYYFGKHDEAEEILNDVLAKDPDNEKAVDGLLKIYLIQNRIEEARLLLSPFLNRKTFDIPFIIIHSYLNGCDKLSDCENAVKLAEEYVGCCQDHENDFHVLYFLLGNHYDKQNNYDKAFSYYSKGNALFEKNTGSFEHDIEELKKLCEIFNINAYHAIPASDETSDKPVFIIGMPRSGTSLTEQILTCHPDVYGLGEDTMLNSCFKEFKNNKAKQPSFPECMLSLSKEDMNNMSNRYMAHILDKSGSNHYKRIINKLPGNFIILILIKKLFPNSRIIHCVRNPLDTCLSIYFQSFAGVHNYAYNLEKLGKYYSMYQKVMSHQTETLGIDVMTLRYEDLIQDQELWTRKLLEYCGLEWNDACLDFHKSGRHVITASLNQVNKPIYTSSINRWKHYEKHLGPLLEALDYTENEVSS